MFVYLYIICYSDIEKSFSLTAFFESVSHRLLCSTFDQFSSVGFIDHV